MRARVRARDVSLEDGWMLLIVQFQGPYTCEDLEFKAISRLFKVVFDKNSRLWMSEQQQQKATQ